MKNLLLLLVLISLTTIQINSFGNGNCITITEQEREYLDLTQDPVNPNGVSQQEEAQLLANGWTKEKLKEDFYGDVQFKDSNGNLYRKQGWLEAGTELYVNRNDMNTDGGLLLQMCTNVEYDWRVLQHIW